MAIPEKNNSNAVKKLKDNERNALFASKGS